MSFKALNWAFELDLEAPEKPVLVALADRADDKKGLSCFPGIKDLVRRSGFKRTAVIGAVKRLEELGHIRVNRSFGKVNKYVVIMNQTSPPDGPVRQTDQSARPTTPVRQTDGTSPPDGPEPLINHQGTTNSIGKKKSIGRKPKKGSQQWLRAKQEDPNTKLQKRVGALVGREPGTRWTNEEAEALAALTDGPVHDGEESFEDQLKRMEPFYEADIKENDWRKQKLITLLNNWTGELDKAARHAASRKKQ